MSDNSSDNQASDNEVFNQENIEEEEPFEDDILNEEMEASFDQPDSAVEIQQVGPWKHLQSRFRMIQSRLRIERRADIRNLRFQKRRSHSRELPAALAERTPWVRIRSLCNSAPLREPDERARPDHRWEPA